MRPTRLITLTVAIAVVVVASFFIRPILGSEETTTYRNDQLGWTVTLPPGWERIQPESSVQPPPPDLGPALARNTFFANGPATAIDDQPISGIDDLTAPPDGGIVIWIAPTTLDGVELDMVDDDSSYPPAPGFPSGETSIDHDSTAFRADGLGFSVGAFYGTGISEDDRSEAVAIATSVAVPPAPAPPPEGSATVRFPDRPDVPAWRVGPADRFQPGTVVEVAIEPTPGVEQPTSLFIVTPDRPIDGAEHWMISEADRRCHHEDLTWDGKVFRCDGRSFHEDGTPTNRLGDGLWQSSVVRTWEGQLITAFNGAVSTSQAAA